jgi:hypothetical protein
MEAGQTEAEEVEVVVVLTVASSLRHPLRRYTTARERRAASHHRRYTTAQARMAASHHRRYTTAQARRTASHRHRYTTATARRTARNLRHWSTRPSSSFAPRTSYCRLPGSFRRVRQSVR